MVVVWFESSFSTSLEGSLAIAWSWGFIGARGLKAGRPAEEVSGFFIIRCQACLQGRSTC